MEGVLSHQSSKTLKNPLLMWDWAKSLLKIVECWYQEQQRKVSSILFAPSWKIRLWCDQKQCNITHRGVVSNREGVCSRGRATHTILRQMSRIQERKDCVMLKMKYNPLKSHPELWESTVLPRWTSKQAVASPKKQLISLPLQNSLPHHLSMK